MSISIVIPVHNNSQTIGRCLNSIIHQPLINNISIIAINDHSTDGSVQIIQQYHRVTLINTSEHGVAAARNLGIQKANSEYIWFIDADDYLERSTINSAFWDSLKEHPDILIIGVRKDNGRTKAIAHSAKFQLCQDTDLIAGNIFEKNILNCVWNKIIRLDLVKQHNLLMPNYSIGEDAIFVYQLLAKAKTVMTIPDVIYHFNMASPTSTKRKWKPDQLNASIAMTKKLDLLYSESNWISESTFSKQLLEIIMSNEINFLQAPHSSYQWYSKQLQDHSMRHLLKLAKQYCQNSNRLKYYVLSNALLSYFLLKKRFA